VALLYGEEGEIADLAVAPAARRLGVGGLLLDRVVAEAMESGVRALYLEVRESNSAARALYHSRGFDTVGRRRRYYQRPAEDALVLRRDMAPA
jgi:ribosomal-protein-alanine N-acetyltransferase